MSDKALKTSPLAQWHKSCNAQFTAFAGWEMPLQYTNAGILAEHHQTRKGASLFDVSHMFQMRLTGPDRHTNIDRLLPIAAEKLKLNRNKYCCLSNSEGGAIDDLVAGNDEQGWFIISNAARATEVKNHVQAHLQGNCNLDVITGHALLAIQGPLAAELISGIFPAIAELYFMDSRWCDYNGCEVRICRCGYTGEDGFEILVPANHAEQLAKQICASGVCRPAGLGARDTLRLEAGLCLYGQDLTSEWTLIESGLTFCMSPSRRKSGGFIGAQTILRKYVEGASRNLVGIKVDSKQALRAKIELTCDGQPAGVVTSGNHSPTLGYPIALALVATQYSEPGTQLTASQRGRDINATVVKLPFVAHNYHLLSKKK